MKVPQRSVKIKIYVNFVWQNVQTHSWQQGLICPQWLSYPKHRPLSTIQTLQTILTQIPQWKCYDNRKMWLLQCLYGWLWTNNCPWGIAFPITFYNKITKNRCFSRFGKLSISVSDELIPAAQVDSSNVLDSSVLKFFELAAIGCSKVKTEIPEMQTWQAAIQSCSYKWVFLKNWQFLEKDLLRIAICKEHRSVAVFQTCLIYENIYGFFLLKMNYLNGIFQGLC